MSFKHVALALLALLALAITWRLAQSDWARQLGQPAAKPLAPIVFDNGTVRQYDSPASVAARNKGQPMPLGTLRKCQRGTEVSYTNSFCPPGTRELKLDKGTPEWRRATDIVLVAEPSREDLRDLAREGSLTAAAR